MLVAIFNGLYCSITHLHDDQCQPVSLMNTQQMDVEITANHDRGSSLGVLELVEDNLRAPISKEFIFQ